MNSRQQPKQRGLWDQIVPNPGPIIKAAMNEALRGASMSREQIVDEMNRLACLAGITCGGRGQKVTTSILDKWVAPGSDKHFIPLRMLPIFCRAVGSNLPLEAYSVCFSNARIISEEDATVLDWAKTEIVARKTRKAAKRLAREVGAA